MTHRFPIQKASTGPVEAVPWMGGVARKSRMARAFAVLVLSGLAAGFANADEPNPTAAPDAEPEVFIQTERKEVDLAPDSTLRVVNRLGDVRARRSPTDQLSVIHVTQRFRADQTDAEVEIKESKKSVEVIAKFPSAFAEATPQGLAGRIDITILVPSGAKMAIETQAGMVEVRGVRRNLEARSESGKIRVSTSHGVVAHSESGQVGVTLRDPGLDSPAHLTTKSGNIRADFPKDPLPALFAQTRGTITVVSLPETPHPDEDSPTLSVLEVGKKPAVIRVESRTGSIDLYAQEPSRLR